MLLLHIRGKIDMEHQAPLSAIQYAKPFYRFLQKSSFYIDTKVDRNWIAIELDRHSRIIFFTRVAGNILPGQEKSGKCILYRKKTSVLAEIRSQATTRNYPASLPAKLRL